MKLNKEKLDQMVEAVMNATHSPKELEDKYEFNYKVFNTRLRIRTALTPFCMEMTDEEIENNGIEGGLRDNELQLFWEGAKFIRDGNK